MSETSPEKTKRKMTAAMTSGWIHHQTSIWFYPSLDPQDLGNAVRKIKKLLGKRYKQPILTFIRTKKNYNWWKWQETDSRVNDDDDDSFEFDFSSENSVEDAKPPVLQGYITLYTQSPLEDVKDLLMDESEESVSSAIYAIQKQGVTRDKLLRACTSIKMQKLHDLGLVFGDEIKRRWSHLNARIIPTEAQPLPSIRKPYKRRRRRLS